MTPTGALIAYLQPRGLTLDRQVLRDALHTLVQALMESEVSRMLDAAPYERIGSRRAYRNGYRESLWRTALGDLEVRIPKLRKGSYYPVFLNPQAESLFVRLIEDAQVCGITLDDLQRTLETLGVRSLARADAADILERLTDVVYNARHRPLRNAYPALFLDVLDVEQGGFLRQILVALGVRPSGEVDLLGYDLVSLADDRAWGRLLRLLRQRGLDDVEVIVSGDHPGVRTAVERELVSAVWQHHRNFLLRGSAEVALVNAVSTLAVRAESDARDLPRMMLAVIPEAVPVEPFFFVMA